MTFLQTMLAKAVKTVEESNLMAEVAKWKEMFNSFFNSETAEEFKKGDEGFYNLLRLGQHNVVVEKVIEIPAAFCRGNLLSALFLGKSQEKVTKPGETSYTQVEHTFPRPTADIALMAAEAITPILFGRLQEIAGRHQGGVGRGFWIVDPNHTNFNSAQTGGEDAKNAQATMHCLLNVVEGVSPSDKVELGELFRKMFNNLPPGVYHRVKVEQPNINGQQKHFVGATNKAAKRQDEEISSAPKPKKNKSDGKKPKKLTDESVPVPPTPAEQLAAAAANLHLDASAPVEQAIAVAQ